MSKTLKIGDKIPKFSLNLSNDTVINSKDLIGKTYVLYFYPKDNTPGCTNEAKDFSCLLKDFKKLNVEIIGVSKDSIKTHQNFIEKHKLKIKLGSDLEGKVIEKFGVWVEKKMYGRIYMGIERSSFLISDNGRIENIWRKVRVKGHAKEVYEKISC
ncbi:MAG: thioredoxin-dependent thiol peroxidase [Pseudomonadota bacterium]|nr:thioredoxin-dependent thiol peroxidase [Pseudomonadota bacterium]